MVIAITAIVRTCPLYSWVTAHPLHAAPKVHELLGGLVLGTIMIIIVVIIIVIMVTMIMIMVIVPGRFTGSRFTCGYFCACPCLIILAIDTVKEKLFKVSRRGQDHLKISGFIEILSTYRENYLCLLKSYLKVG